MIWNNLRHLKTQNGWLMCVSKSWLPSPCVQVIQILIQPELVSLQGWWAAQWSTLETRVRRTKPLGRLVCACKRFGYHQQEKGWPIDGMWWFLKWRNPWFFEHPIQRSLRNITELIWMWGIMGPTTLGQPHYHLSNHLLIHWEYGYSINFYHISYFYSIYREYGYSTSDSGWRCHGIQPEFLRHGITLISPKKSKLPSYPKFQQKGEESVSKAMT